MVQRLWHYGGMSKKTGSIWDVDMEKDGACKMDKQNKECSCVRKSGRRKNNAGTDKEEEKKLAGTLAKKELVWKFIYIIYKMCFIIKTLVFYGGN